jgi:uncharacterized protein DUF5662
VIAHLRYLSYVLRHKWHVFYAGLFLGVPLWRLIIHDLSKFSRAEWTPYVDYFFGAWWPKEDNDHPVRHAFELAWRHHWEHNPHHWNYWYRPEEDGTLRANWMPPTYVREMVADWYGAGMAQGKPDVAAWYQANTAIQLHPSARYLVTQVLKEAQRKGLIP